MMEGMLEYERNGHVLIPDTALHPTFSGLKTMAVIILLGRCAWGKRQESALACPQIVLFYNTFVD